MTGPRRVGVVGCGRVFQRYHLPCLRDRPEIAVVAACDTDPARARTVLGGIGPAPFVTDDLTAFFDRGRPEAVVVCTPNDAHTEPALATLRRGLPLLCEKPLAATVEDAERIAEAAAGAGLAMVNTPYRRHELIAAFQAALPDGDCAVEVVFTTPGLRLWRPVTQWYHEPARAGGGALLDLGMHAVDLLTALFGPAEPVRCAIGPGRRGGAGSVEEFVEAELRVGRGDVRMTIDRSHPSGRLEVTARRPDRVVTLDLRRGEVRADGAVLAATTRPRPELAAIEWFLTCLVDGRDEGAATVTEAARLQRLLSDLYAIADRSAMTGRTA